MLWKNCMSMGNVKEVLYEYGKFCGRILWVWEMLWKNCMSMGKVREELFELVYVNFCFLSKQKK